MADYQYVLAVHADAARKRQKRQREMQGLGEYSRLHVQKLALSFSTVTIVQVIFHLQEFQFLVHKA